MKKLLSLLLLSFLLSACQQNNNQIKVGTISGPETELMEVAKTVAKEKYGLAISIKTFTDYVIPNIALNEGSIDANVFQHQPYLEASIKSRGYDLISIGKTFVYPMAIYSKTYKALTELPQGATIAVPNDPSNEARALLLLQKAGLITISKKYDATIMDITKNPRGLKIKPLAAPQLPRALEDVDAAVINTNYALVNQLSPEKDSLFVEDKDSPYANIIVIKRKDLNKPDLKLLVKVLNSPEVLAKAKQLFKGQAIPAW